MVRVGLLGAAALLLLVWTAPASAAEKPAFGPPPAWVQVLDIPVAPPPEGAPAVQMLLDDNQTRLSPDGDAFYNRRVRKVLRTEGLAGFTSLGFTWKPDTDAVTFHTLKIIRGDKVIDLLGAGDKMLVLRRETGLEQAMLDGRITASQQLEGLQVGDILDFAFTYTSHDPILQGHSYENEGLTFAGVAARYHMKTSWPKGDPIRWRATPGFGTPTVSEHDGRAWLELDATGVQAPKAPVGAPPRFRRLGSLEASGFTTWREVSSLMRPLYDKAARLKPDSPIRAEARTIAAASRDPKDRAFAALKLVEDKTRYFFIGIGDGGYVPAAADETWTRKFGDCKAKTALLLALLHELGVQAEPALVSLGGGDGMDERPPSAAAFNHVVVRATIAGQVYWLDGTRTGDNSGLAALKPPNHRWALPLRPAGADLEKIVIPPLSEPQIDSSVRLDATGGLGKPAPVKLAMRMRGDLATALRQIVARAPKADLERSLRQTYSSTMSWIDVESIEWRDDAAHDAFEVDILGSADMDWRPNPDVGRREYKVAASSTQPGGYPRREPGPNRDAPFAVPYPLFIRSLVEIDLPDAGRGFSVRGPNGAERVGGLELTRHSTLEGGVARFSTEARSVAEEISAEEAESATRTLRRLAGEDSLVRAPS